MEAIKCVLGIYSWGIIGILIALLGRIAFFYEKTSGQKVGYYFLLLPAVLLAAGAIWYLTGDVEFTGEPIGDLLLFGGGVLLCLFGGRLQESMTGKRQ
jgi:hypothetical protein